MHKSRTLALDHDPSELIAEGEPIVAKIQVLIVEDEPIIAADLSDQLHRLGYEVPAIAAHAEEAFLATSAARPDLVLMDINLPGDCDGIEAATRLRSDYDLPVIFLTAHEDIETLQRAQKAEPFGYLTKPARSADLSASIEIALARSREHCAQQLRELWLQAQLQSAGEGSVAASHDGIIRFVNVEGERLLGLTSTEIIGKAFEDAIPLRHQSGEPIRGLVRMTILHGSSTDLEDGYVINRPGGRRIFGRMAVSRIAGEPIGIIFTFRDFTVESSSRTALYTSGPRDEPNFREFF
jgi:two-component system, cell cycle sensor histidine kinase and response regulator CckA